MNLICCNYDCKHQKEGYCYLNDTSKATHTGSSACIFFEPNEEEKEPYFLSSSDDSEPL